MANHVLKQDGRTLSGIFKNAALLKELNELLWQHIEKPLAAHCSVANLQKGHLILIADNGAWATQLRFQVPDLLEKFRQHTLLHGLKSISCKTRPHFKLENSTKKRNKATLTRLSKKTIEHILREADNIQDQKIKATLQRIANRFS